VAAVSDGPGPETFHSGSDPGDEDTVPEGGIPHESNGHLLAEQLRRRLAQNDERRRAMQPTADQISRSLLETAKAQRYVEGGHA
jgi:hypothetical protein